jgi:hypothetical protein
LLARRAGRLRVWDRAKLDEARSAERDSAPAHRALSDPACRSSHENLLGVSEAPRSPSARAPGRMERPGALRGPSKIDDSPSVTAHRAGKGCSAERRGERTVRTPSKTG